MIPPEGEELKGWKSDLNGRDYNPLQNYTVNATVHFTAQWGPQRRSGPNDPIQIPVTGVTIQSTTTIPVGGTQTLAEIISPHNATNKSVNWSTNNPTIATVTTGGTVTGREPGTADITVTTIDGGFQAVCNVTVSESSDTPVVTDPTGPKEISLNNIEISRLASANVVLLNGDTNVDSNGSKNTYWRIKVTFSIVNNRDIAADFEYEVEEGGGDRTKIRLTQRIILPTNEHITSLVTPSVVNYNGYIRRTEHNWFSVRIRGDSPLSNIRAKVDGPGNNNTDHIGLRCNLRILYN